MFVVMSWPTSLVSALLTALLGMLGAGVVAAMVVDWYSISSREGASGYFVVGIALCGFVIGGVIGMIVARSIAAGPQPGFLRALGFSVAIVCVLVLVSGGLARAFADVPPTLDGERLLLEVEVRWPPTQREAPTVAGKDEAWLSLHSVSRFSHVARASSRGPLWMEDAHRVDGRWVVPGAVDVFTGRGLRMLVVNVGDSTAQGFEVPLPASPGAKDLDWSGWLPQLRPGVSAPANMFAYRYRAHKVTQPIRTEMVGAFAISTIAYDFFEAQRDGRTLNAATAKFAVQFLGKPLVIDVKPDESNDSTEHFDRFDEVAVVGGPTPALMIALGASSGTSTCHFVTENGQRIHVEHVGACANGANGYELSRGPDARGRATYQPVRGRVDRIGYERPGIYRLGDAVVDSRHQLLYRFKRDGTFSENSSVPAFGLSPDERSFVLFGSGNGLPAPLLLVTDFVDNRTYALPVDPARMRYMRDASIDDAWLEHHFEWQRGKDGVDRLIERPHFVPLPYRGEFEVAGNGDRTYRLDRGTEELRGALVDFLVRELKATRQPADSGAYEIPVTIDGHTVNVAYSSGSSYVSVSLAGNGPRDSTLVSTIGERFNAALATGRYDNLFVVR